MPSLRMGIGDEGTDEVGFESLDEELADIGLPHSLAMLPGKVAPLRGLVRG